MLGWTLYRWNTDGSILHRWAFGVFLPGRLAFGLPNGEPNIVRNTMTGNTPFSKDLVPRWWLSLCFSMACVPMTYVYGAPFLVRGQPQRGFPICRVYTA